MSEKQPAPLGTVLSEDYEALRGVVGHAELTDEQGRVEARVPLVRFAALLGAERRAEAAEAELQKARETLEWIEDRRMPGDHAEWEEIVDRVRQALSNQEKP